MPRTWHVEVGATDDHRHITLWVTTPDGETQTHALPGPGPGRFDFGELVQYFVEHAYALPDGSQLVGRGLNEREHRLFDVIAT